MVLITFAMGCAIKPEFPFPSNQTFYVVDFKSYQANAQCVGDPVTFVGDSSMFWIRCYLSPSDTCSLNRSGLYFENGDIVITERLGCHYGCESLIYRQIKGDLTDATIHEYQVVYNYAVVDTFLFIDSLTYTKYNPAKYPFVY